MAIVELIVDRLEKNNKAWYRRYGVSNRSINGLDPIPVCLLRVEVGEVLFYGLPVMIKVFSILRLAIATGANCG